MADFMTALGWAKGGEAEKPANTELKALQDQVAALNAKLAAMPAQSVTVVPQAPQAETAWTPPEVAPLDLVTGMPDATLDQAAFANEVSRRTQVYGVSLVNARDAVYQHREEEARAARAREDQNTNLVDGLYDAFNEKYGEALKPDDFNLEMANIKTVRALQEKGMRPEDIQSYVMKNRDAYIDDVANTYKALFAGGQKAEVAAEPPSRTDGMIGGLAHGAPMPTATSTTPGNTGFIEDMRAVQSKMGIF